jgi:hypothetical protein
MRRCAGVFGLLVMMASFAWGDGPGLPPGAGKAKVEASCKQCHDTKVIVKQHQDAKWWAKTLDKMVEHGLEMEPADQAVVLKYLTANFGVKSASGSVKKAAKE